MEMLTWKYGYDMGNIKMTWGKTKSYGLFTRQRDVAVDFDFFVRNASSTSVIFFRHVSLTTVPYVVDVDDVSMIDDRRSVKVNVSTVSFLEFCRRRRCIVIGDRRWWSFPFVIYLSNFVDAKNISTMLKDCLIDQNSSIDDRLKKF
jgi:hypothetical protein